MCASTVSKAMQEYFTVWTHEKAILYSVAIVFVVGVCCAVVVQPFLNLPCDKPASNIEYSNPSYLEGPCQDDRIPVLFFMSVRECIFGRRILMAVILGGLIGWERREADRPAGIRTMSLVSLGSCLFSITSAFAFIHGPMSWDASRVAAAIPSGVGFLGSALIFKQQEDGAHMVHGLTTAASVWLSAAVGIACSGGLYFVASFSCAIMLLVLRFGPRFNFDSSNDSGSEVSVSEGRDHPTNVTIGNVNNSVSRVSLASESTKLLKSSVRGISKKQRPSITIE